MTHLHEIAPRLRQLLLLLSSDQPGEVAAAAAAIGRALRSVRCDWHDLAGALTAAPAQSTRQQRAEPNDTPDEWDAMREFCASRADLLRSREAEFIVSLGEWRGRPTEKQFAWLRSIYARLRRQAA